MGCGASTPIKEDAVSTYQTIPPTTSFQLTRKDTHGEEKLSSSDKTTTTTPSISVTPEPDYDLKSFTNATYRQFPQETQPLQNAAPLTSPRQSLSSNLSSMNRGGTKPHHIKAGWNPGKSVIFREDGRTSQIINLACAITKVPWVIVVTREHGRYAVSGSPSFHKINDRLWLPSFCEWLFCASEVQHIVVEDTTLDQRCSHQPWAISGPKLQFISAIRLKPAEGYQPLGFLCAIHTEKIPNARTFAMLLGDLANMATRELDGAQHRRKGRGEMIIDGQIIPPFLRYRMDTCTWPMILVDVKPPLWTILFGGWSVRSFLGVHPGYLEGHQFWHFFEPILQNGQSSKDPWLSHTESLKAKQFFSIPALAFKQPGGQVQTSNILTKAEMRPMTPEQSKHLDIESAWSQSLWILCLQPEAVETLDNSTRPSNHQPFPAVELGPVIGKGSFGCVCKGMLGSMIVAVKIIEAEMVFKMDNEGQPLEGSLAIDLRHPNIVLMLDYDTHIQMGKTNSLHGSNKGSAGSLGSLAEDEEFIPPEQREGPPMNNQRETIIGNKVDEKSPNENKAENGAPLPVETSSKFDRYLKEKGVTPLPVKKEEAPELPSKHKIQASSFASPQAQSIGGAIHQSQGSGTSNLSIDRRRSLKTLSELHVGSVEAWLLLEYCDQGSLLDAIEEGRFHSGSLEGEKVILLDAILSTAYEVASAMRYLHSLDILHGDLTAGNVLLSSSSDISNDPRGFVAKVADFGLSRQALNSAMATKNYGTVTHMPPEVLNEGLISKSADVYAFGVLLVEMYLGERAYSGKRHPQILHLVAILKQHPELPETAPPFLIELVNSCMLEDPKARISFNKIIDILRPYQKYIIYESSKH